MPELTRQPNTRVIPRRPMPKLAAPKEKHRYIFPNVMAKMMKNVPMNVQLESSMMASGLILIGMILMSILLTFFTEQTITFKVITLVNLIGAFIFISSSLVMTYQQYVSYMDVIDLQRSMGMQDMMGTNLPIDDMNMIRPKNKKNQFLFFGGLVVILLAFIPKAWLWEAAPSLEAYSLWIMIGILLIGALMIFLVFKKKKPKKVIIPPRRQVIQPRPQPVQQPYVKQSQAPVEGPKLAFRAPPQQEIQEPKPILDTVRPVPRRPIPRRPMPAPEERAVPEERAEPVVQARRLPDRAVIEDRPIGNNDAPLKNKRSPRETKMLTAIEKKLNDRLYEINRLKAQQ